MKEIFKLTVFFSDTHLFEHYCKNEAEFYREVQKFRMAFEGDAEHVKVEEENGSLTLLNVDHIKQVSFLIEKVADG